MSRRERLLARQLPTAVVPVTTGGTPELVTLRGLPADEFQVLIEEHPPTAEQAAAGDIWNEDTFRPALLSASEVPLDGEQPLSPEDWAALGPTMPLGERNALFDTALALNDRAPLDAVGKG